MRESREEEEEGKEEIQEQESEEYWAYHCIQLPVQHCSLSCSHASFHLYSHSRIQSNFKQVLTQAGLHQSQVELSRAFLKSSPFG